MAKKRKKQQYDPKKAMFSSSIYSVKATRQKRKQAPTPAAYKAQSNEAQQAIEKGQQMARIEAYAKEHKVTITQAMILFM